MRNNERLEKCAFLLTLHIDWHWNCELKIEQSLTKSANDHQLLHYFPSNEWKIVWIVFFIIFIVIIVWFDLFIVILGYFQSISEFLKNLPCHNEKNFALFNTENGIRTSSRRPSVYLPTVDIPSEQSKCDNWLLHEYASRSKHFFLSMWMIKITEKNDLLILFMNFQ